MSLLRKDGDRHMQSLIEALRGGGGGGSGGSSSSGGGSGSGSGSGGGGEKEETPFRNALRGIKCEKIHDQLTDEGVEDMDELYKLTAAEVNSISSIGVGFKKRLIQVRDITFVSYLQLDDPRH